MDRVTIQVDDFDLSHEVAALRRADKGVGAVCIVVGLNGLAHISPSCL